MYADMQTDRLTYGQFVQYFFKLELFNNNYCRELERLNGVSTIAYGDVRRPILLRLF